MCLKDGAPATVYAWYFDVVGGFAPLLWPLVIEVQIKHVIPSIPATRMKGILSGHSSSVDIVGQRLHCCFYAMRPIEYDRCGLLD